MIHDILLSCLNLYSNQCPIEEFVLSDAVSEFFHPCEKVILQDIIEIINLLRNVAKFAKLYRKNYAATSYSSTIQTDEPLRNGLYLKAFSNGIDKVLEDYFDDITELEKRYLQNSTHSLMFIYQKIQEYKPLALFLRKVIRDIRIQKLHGCSIVQYLHQNAQHGDKRIYDAMKKIQSTVNVLFLKQLTNWILYAKIVDTYGEFFIQCNESRNSVNDTLDSDKRLSMGSGKHTVTTVSDPSSSYGDIWRYEICYDLLPHYLSYSWAEKILFIGQTVLIFQVDFNSSKNNIPLWNNSSIKYLNNKDSLWNGQEHIFYAKIQSLQSNDEPNVSLYEHIVDEIKSYVTKRLSEIAINQADLENQLTLIKDFYLLSRGELYLEFIQQIYNIKQDEDNENKLREVVKAFETAANSLGLSDELEKFSLCVTKPIADCDTTHEFGFLQHIHLQYQINWPLHLLFSPKVIERYNTLFRFLLLIKKMQYRLHMIWYLHSRESKSNKRQSIRIMHLRNQLMFFIDNLQYYIQVDVLESQFSILHNVIRSKADFEQIQRAHSIFQANILSLCFLLSDEDTSKISIHQNTTNFNNPVYIILNEIFHLCDQFCSTVSKIHNNVHDLNILDKNFRGLIEQLINLLVGIRTGPTSTPLSQLLLRLDFNHWFSLNRKCI